MQAVLLPSFRLIVRKITHPAYYKISISIAFVLLYSMNSYSDLGGLEGWIHLRYIDFHTVRDT